MLVQSIPYPAGGFSGALARRDTSATIPSGEPYTYPIEQYDTAGYFTTASSTVMTVPADGVYSVYAQTFALDGNFNRIDKNSAGFAGSGLIGSGGTVPGHNIVCAPNLCSLGNTFRVISANASLAQSPSHTSATNVNWFQIEKRPAGVRYAVVRKNADQSIGANTFTTATWQTELADVGGWFDAGTNDTQFVVPAGVSLVRIRTGMVTSESGSGPSIVGTRRNGASQVGLPRIGSQGASKWASAMGAPIEVEAGDNFDYRVLTTLAANLSTSNGTWFAIEEVTDIKERVLLSRTASLSVTANNSALIEWDSTAYKTQSGMHSGSTNPARLIVPDGCSKARLIINARNTLNVNFGYEITTFKNGVTYPGRIFNRAGSRDRNAVSAWVDVVPGDYFTVEIAAGSTNFTSDTSFTWACLECQ
jgi:hypothetical protein